MRLPDRRQGITQAVTWRGTPLTVQLGFDGAGAVREIFINGAKGGSDVEALFDDACILASILLQYGVSPEELAQHLGREGTDPTSPAASLIGQAARIAAAASGGSSDG